MQPRRLRPRGRFGRALGLAFGLRLGRLRVRQDFGGVFQRLLAGAAQQYVYFLVRQDGSYLIKRREGEKTSDVSKGWVQHAAVKKPDAKGTATNLLEVDHKRDSSRVAFLVNGQEVYATDASAMNLDGIVGIRTNHNLDLHIEGFDVHR